MILDFLSLSRPAIYQPLSCSGQPILSHPHPTPSAQGQSPGGWLPAWGPTDPLARSAPGFSSAAGHLGMGLEAHGRVSPQTENL